MKPTNKTTVKLTVITLLAGLIVGFTHCVPKVTKEVGDGGGRSERSTVSTPAAAKTEGQIIAEAQVTVGVKNFEGILHTMAAVTGIDPFAIPALLTVYREVESGLPSDNDIKVFTATQQVAVTKLAAEFCFHLTQAANDPQLKRIWPGFVLNRQVQVAFSEANAEVFVDNTIKAFWGDIISAAEYDMAMNELLDLATQLRGTDTTSTAATGRVVRGVCTAALSSAYVTLL